MPYPVEVISQARAMMVLGKSDYRITLDLAEMFEKAPDRTTVNIWRRKYQKEDPTAIREEQARIAERAVWLANAKLDEIEKEAEETGKVPISIREAMVTYGIAQQRYQQTQALVAQENRTENWQLMIETTMQAMVAAGKNPAGAFARLSAPIDAEVREVQ